MTPGRPGAAQPERGARVGVPQRVALLVNPAAGHHRAVAIADLAARYLRQRGVEVETVTGRHPAETLEHARLCVSSGAEVLAVVGGDGLVHLALQAAAGTDTALAVVPAGTGNDFARALGIPRADPQAAVALVLGGVRRSIDLGRTTAQELGAAPNRGTVPQNPPAVTAQRWFGTILTSGFDSLVTDRANRMRWPSGAMRYNAAMVAELGLLRPYPFVLDVDGERHELDATLVAVGNSTSYGGGMRMCPDASMDDGRLSVTVVTAVGRARLLRVFPRVYRGTHITHPAVRTFTARRIRLHTEGMRGYADGEPLGLLPLDVQAVPHAVQVIVPPATPA